MLPGGDSAAAALETAFRQRPAVLLMDKALGVQAALDMVPALRRGAPETALVLWGVSITEAEALRCLQAGVRGVLRKASSPEILIECLKAVAAGQNWMEDSVFKAPPASERSHRSELTPREQQVMELVEHGLKNREIARELGIRPGTVKIHLKHIFEKTGVRGRYGLALTGMRQKGLLSIPPGEGPRQAA